MDGVRSCAWFYRAETFFITLLIYRYLLRFITTTRTCAHLGGTCSDIPEAMRRSYSLRRGTWACISTRGLRYYYTRQYSISSYYYTAGEHLLQKVSFGEARSSTFIGTSLHHEYFTHSLSFLLALFLVIAKDPLQMHVRAWECCLLAENVSDLTLY